MTANHLPGSIETEQSSATLTTRDGLVLVVRTVRRDDGPLLDTLFEQVAPADLRSRFLSAMRHVDRSRIDSMIDVDYDRTITFVALDPVGAPVGSMMVATDDDRKDAEVAISVRSDMKGHGVGWTLLQHAIRYAQARGFENITSLESRQSSETIALERDAGFTFHTCDGDPSEVIAVKHLVNPDG